MGESSQKWYVSGRGPVEVNVLSVNDDRVSFEHKGKTISRKSDLIFETEEAALNFWIEELEEYWVLDDTSRSLDLLDTAKKRLAMLKSE
jgi:hypothetical protein